MDHVQVTEMVDVEMEMVDVAMEMVDYMWTYKCLVSLYHLFHL